MHGIAGDVRYSLRMLAKHPSFSIVSILTLAIGIGAVSAVFSVVYSLLWRPLDFQDPDGLVFLSERSKSREHMSVSYPNFMDWRDENQVFEQVAAHRPTSFNLTGTARPERLAGAQVSATLLPMLGIEPIMGRGFREEEDQPGAEPVVLLGYGFWQRRLGGNPALLEQSLSLDGNLYSIIGVTPRGFSYPIPMYNTDIDVYLPIGQFSAAWQEQRGNHPAITVTARLKAGIGREQARRDMALIAERLEKEYPETNAGQSVRVDGLQEFHARDIRSSLVVLLAAVGLVLLIACANVANLLLARASTRSQEISVRTALGAGRARVIRQLLVESVILSLMGGGIGLLLSIWGVDLLSLLIPDSTSPIYHHIEVDHAVFGFTLLVSILTGVVFGLVPALQCSKPNLTASLKEGGKSASVSRKSQRVRAALVVAEVALAVVLLIGSGLMIKSLLQVLGGSPGFDSRNVATLAVAIPEAKYPEPHQQIAFYQTLENRIGALPGVRSVGMTDPLLWGSDYYFVIEGRPAPEPGSGWVTDGLVVSPDYFQTMKIPLLQGRLFTEGDRDDAFPVAVIDREFSELHWPGDDPIGKRVKLSSDPDSSRPWLEVIGVVGNVKNLGVDRDSRETIYQPYFQEAETYMTMVIEADSSPESVAAMVRREVSRLDPDQPIYRVGSLDQYLADRMVPRRISSATLVLFAALALAMASVGIYGLLAYAVSRRQQEIGIRMAMGAKAPDIVRMVLGQAAGLTALGVIIGLWAAFLATPLLAGLLFGVNARDPITFMGIAFLLGSVALASAFLPARRAARVEPLAALRHE